MKLISPEITNVEDDSSPVEEALALPERTEQARLQLEASFDKMADVLEGVDWKEQEIEHIATAAYYGMYAEAYELAARLEANIHLVEMRESQQILWKQWIEGISPEELEKVYDDPMHASVDKLRMQIANLVAKLGAQTS